MDEIRARLIKETFDSVADGYDIPALRFFPRAAASMTALLALRGDERALDVACGTGHATLALARRLPRGRVTAVDFSARMLDQARAKATTAALGNIDFVEADMQELPWQSSFDVAVCAFGIFFAEDMEAQLRRIAGTVKPGGRLAISTFAGNYMEPLRSMLIARVGRFGVEPPPPTWLRTANQEGCKDLFSKAGLHEITVDVEDVGYVLSGPEQWWEIVWNAGFRRLVTRVSAERQAAFRTEHLAEVEALRTPAGIAMPVPVLFTTGVVHR